MASVKIVLVHGIGHEHEEDGWLDSWKASVRSALNAAGGSNVKFQIEPLLFKHRFEEYDLNAAVYLSATAQLVSSWVKEAALKALGLRGVPLSVMVRWYAGMVAQWAVYDDLRAALRADLLKLIEETRPDLVLAHSMGSLIAYDTFLNLSGSPAQKTAQRKLLKDVKLFTFGSQINHPSVLGQWRAGRLEPLTNVERWYHLYNKNDWVFTNRIPRSFPDTVSMEAKFGKSPFAHGHEDYLMHEQAVATLWSDVVMEATGSRVARAAAKKATASVKDLAPSFFVKTGRVANKALHVGVDEYSSSKMSPLLGCVNDCYLMSATVQACGVPVENVRLVTNARATTAGIRKRIEWLLDDAQPGDTRVLSFSGHGTRLPVYGPDETVDSYIECLCPHDFDWSVGKAITDVELQDIYSQLPYDLDFLIVLDACHSGGMSRDGLRRVRSSEPPDDIRHRALEWSEKLQMWLPRKIGPINKHVQSEGAKGVSSQAARFIGSSGATQRIGASLDYRTLDKKVYDRVRKAQGHHGPFMPLMLLACTEEQFASEYYHGSVSYGAFTYSVTTAMRRLKDRDKKLTYKDLVAESCKVMERCEYEQTPQIVGPRDRQNEVVPFLR